MLKEEEDKIALRSLLKSFTNLPFTKRNKDAVVAAVSNSLGNQKRNGEIPEDIDITVSAIPSDDPNVLNLGFSESFLKWFTEP